MATTSTLRSAHVLVTGGAGFIGSHLVGALLREGAWVRVIDNFSTGHRRNLSGFRDRVHVIEADIRDVESCRAACHGARFVLHQAALGSVPRSMVEPETTMAVNVSGTANILSAARDAGVERVVYASSSAVYGDSDVSPKREGEEGRPMSPYALSKRMNEELADVFARCYDMTSIGLRYFNVYGPRQDPDGPYAAVIPRFFAAFASDDPPTIYGDGLQSRDFTFVGDVVSANLRALLGPLSGAEVFNVGSGRSTTVLELAESIREITGASVAPKHAPARQGDVLHSLAEVARAADAFGYRPLTTLDSGLRVTHEQALWSARPSSSGRAAQRRHPSRGASQ